MEQLLRNLEAQGIQLWVEDGRLRFRAPQGVMTTALRTELQAHKTDLIAHLQSKQATTIVPLPEQADYALSSAQWRLWVLTQLENSSVAYNVPLYQLITGNLDVDRLRYTLQQVTARHESLRTAFALVNGEPRQQINPTATIRLELVDVSGAADPEAVARQMSLEEAQRPFDLTVAPLCRAKLVRLEATRHALLLTLHHLICDGVSIGVLNREIAHLYDGHRLPSLHLQYRDYAHWQNGWLESDEAAQHQRYWLKQLAGELPVLHLPIDFPRPVVQSFNGREYPFTLSPDKLAQLKQLARREGVTLFMLLLAILKTLLYRYTQQNDMIVGTPVAARPHADLYDQIGFYLNNLPLRSQLEPERPFTHLLGQIKQTATGGLEHQFYPFDRLVNEVAVRRDLSRSPLFDVMLILQNQADEGMRLGNLQVRPFYQHSQTSKLDLTFNFNEDAAGLHLGLEYNSDLFTPERIERVVGHWQTLVEGILADPERPLTALPLLTTAEEEQILTEFNRPVTFPDQSVVDLWTAAVVQQGEKTAIIAGDNQLTYAELDALTDRLAHALHRAGIEAEDRVALLLNRSHWLPVALLAILKAGAAYVPLDPAYPHERIATILQHSESKLLLTEEACLPEWRKASIPATTIDELRRRNYEGGTHPSSFIIHPSSLAYVTYTSGSTGQPKGVMVTQGNLVAFTENLTARWGLTAADRLLALTTITFDIAGLELLCSLLVGMTIHIPPAADVHEPERVFDLLRRHEITALQLTPSHLKLLLTGGDVMALAPLRVLLIGGEALPPALFEQIRPLLTHVIVYNVYGPTETTIWSTSKQLNDGVLNIGTPLLNETVTILDPHNNLCPIGVVGEICVGGAGVARGYWKEEGRGQKAENFFRLPSAFFLSYKTGDLGYWLPHGEIVCLGRRDDQVKVRGFRVELGEVEAGLIRCEGVATAVAAVRPDSFGDNQLVAWFVPDTEAVPAAGSLRRQLHRWLPNYMIPAMITPITAVPLTPNGKVNRKALLATTVTAVSTTGYTPPRNELEEQMAAIWAAVLEQPRVGIDDNFFDLGGHSLKAMRIAARVQQEMGLAMRLLDLFQQQTIGTLTAVLAQPAVPFQEEIPAGTIAPMTAEEMALLWEDL